MICVSGAVDVVCEDGAQQKFVLDRGDVALLMPPGLWNIVESGKAPRCS